MDYDIQCMQAAKFIMKANDEELAVILDEWFPGCSCPPDGCPNAFKANEDCKQCMMAWFNDERREYWRKRSLEALMEDRIKSSQLMALDAYMLKETGNRILH